MSCLEQWRRELEFWTHLNVVMYHGNAQSRNLIQEHEFYFEGQKKNILKFHVLLTTYEVVRTDVQLLSKIAWQYMVLDEAHRIKVNFALWLSPSVYPTFLRCPSVPPPSSSLPYVPFYYFLLAFYSLSSPLLPLLP